MQNQTPILYQSKRFSTYQNFENDLQEYQNQVRQDFVKQHTTLLGDKKLKYKNVKFSCIYGQHRGSETTGKRASSTLKRGCEASIYLSVDSKTNELVLRKLMDHHTNHDGLEEYRNELSINRRLNEAEQNIIQEYYVMGCQKRGIREKLQRTTKKNIYRKDLDNVIKKLRNADDDTLKVALKFLNEEQNADVYVYDSNGVFQGLYFVTDSMVEDMKRFPEIVFTDGTYKLFKRKFVLQLFAVEDNYGETQFVGIGILANETLVTLKWLFDVFKKSHGEEVCKKIKSFMTDKDLIERSVINQVFPHTSTLLCKFHTKKTFKTNITTRKMKISCIVVDECLEILNKMSDSTTEHQYDELYKQFCKIAEGNEKLLDYFNDNWHSIRLEWTTYGMNRVVNLGNFSNNRVESNNSKLKNPQWLKPNDTLTSALKNLCAWLMFRQDHQRLKRAQLNMKIDANPVDSNSVLGIFKNNLTPFAYEKVKYDLENYHSEELQVVNSSIKKCKIITNKETISVTPNSCGCSKWIAQLLICRHILAVRKLFNLPLFTKSLCTRWCRFATESKQDNTQSGAKVELHHGPSISQMNRKEKLSDLHWTLKNIFYMAYNCVGEKLKTRYLILKNIDNNIQKENNNEDEVLTEAKTKMSIKKVIENMNRKISQLNDKSINYELNHLKSIEKMWTKNIVVDKEKPFMNMDSSFANLSIENDTMIYKKIVLPPQTRKIGRAGIKESKCTIIKKKKKHLT